MFYKALRSRTIQKRWMAWTAPLSPPYAARNSVAFSEHPTLLERAIVIMILSVCPSVCLSVCQTRGLWQNGRKFCQDFYTT